MMISKIKVLSVAVLACVLTLGGLQTFARHLGGTGAKPAAEAKAEEPQAELTRSTEKLQAELDESARRQAEMRKELAEIRAISKPSAPGQCRSRAEGRPAGWRKRSVAIRSVKSVCWPTR